MIEAVPGTPIRILLLEDSALDAELITAQLRLARLSVAIHRVWTRDTFLAALFERRFDVILSDHLLPGFDGDSALVLAREHAPELPFIFVSGTLTEELAVQALKRGARDYVVKQRLQRLPDAILRGLRENEELNKLRLAEENLRLSQERLQSIADALPALIGHLDAGHRYLFANDAHRHWVGLAPDRLVGMHAGDVFGRDWFAGAEPFLVRAIAGERTTFEIELPGHAGDAARHAQIDCVAEIASDGTIAGYYMLARDISELKRAELALKETNGSLERQVIDHSVALQGSESRLEAIFESSFQLQILLAPDGTIIDANVASLAAVLLEKREVRGQRLSESAWFASTPGSASVVETAIAGAADGRSSRQEFELQLATGLRSFEFSFRPLRDPAGAITAMVAEAVETTARREAERALQQAQKIEAIGQLTGGIAHDFNNILTIITGNIEVVKMLLDRPDSAEKSGRALDNALKGVSNAASLTQRLLAFARRQPLIAQPVDCRAQVLGMGDMLRRALGELVQLKIVAPEVWSVELDPAQFEASLLNLAVNARDAMPSGGALTIELGNAHLGEGDTARLPGLDPGQYVMLRVKDTGEGMSAETMARVFEPFFTTKEVGKGTGLGLSMVYGFVQQSGGQVLLESTVGVGTVITLIFPRSMSALPVSHDSGTGSDEHEKREATILVSEDNDDVRAYVVEVLRDIGYRVLEAHDGESAIRLLERPDVAVDLLLSDVVMPGMSGWELAQRARRIKSGLKVLFMSGYPRNLAANEDTVRDAGILAKPFTRSDLAHAVGLAVDGAQEKDSRRSQQRDAR
ncbi:MULTISPECIES: response regulator [Rhodanobacteraceae]|uniref:response regulator n=1 Tax=Rhodanobacteraceae TaxID=1775411 RepID=UPI0008868022|nr:MULTISPECIES: response regulator [Rhodanobacteraceae]SDG31359.1 PAS domain S-box-containing protein [Dyella sp. 333MFSha]SKB67121.1 PAS/PAC sensor hybrid histidine kinase [Luteibacter sp. 22Crub2.1]